MISNTIPRSIKLEHTRLPYGLKQLKLSLATGMSIMLRESFLCKYIQSVEFSHFAVPYLAHWMAYNPVTRPLCRLVFRWIVVKSSVCKQPVRSMQFLIFAVPWHSCCVLSSARWFSKNDVLWHGCCVCAGWLIKPNVLWHIVHPTKVCTAWCWSHGVFIYLKNSYTKILKSFPVVFVYFKSHS